MAEHNPAEDKKRDRKKVSRKISLLKREGKPQKQAVAQAHSMLRQGKL